MRDRELCQIESARDVVLSANYDWVFTVNKNNCGFHLRRMRDEHAFVSSFCYTALCACCCSRGVAGACQVGPSSKHKIELSLWCVSLVCHSCVSFQTAVHPLRVWQRTGQMRDDKSETQRCMRHISCSKLDKFCLTTAPAQIAFSVKRGQKKGFDKMFGSRSKVLNARSFVTRSRS